MSVLAIDQGTTSTRALIVTPDGGVTPLLNLPHRQIYPQGGWVEHDPAELVAALRACLAAAGRIGDLRAVGLANQGESCLAWDGATGDAIGPVIVWQDGRTLDVTEALRRDGAEALVMARTGLPLDPYFSAAKLGWIMRNNPRAPELAAKGRLRLGTTDAYFRDVLTGRFETDATTASRTSLMDLERGTWDPELCALFGVPIEALPRITPTTGDLGLLDCGSRQIPLTASVVDQQASLYGHGCRVAGDAKITFGTGAFALVVTGARLQRPDGPLPTLAWARGGEPATYALDGGVYAASAAVNWAQGLGLFGDLAEITHFETESAIARGLAFVPALAGLACPHWDRRARGAWMGLALDTGPSDMMQALLEGVAFRMAEAIAALAKCQPLRDPISVDGGMIANPWFCQFLCDTLGRDLLISDQPELTALGTAALAADGAGLPLQLPRSGRLLQPRPQPAAWAARFASAREAVQRFGRAASA